jgi:hypothetical protein
MNKKTTMGRTCAEDTSPENTNMNYSGLRFFNEPEISDPDPQLKVPPGGFGLRDFYVLKKQ